MLFIFDDSCDTLLEGRSRGHHQLLVQVGPTRTMPAVRTCAGRGQAANSAAGRISLTNTDADLDAEIEADLAGLSQAADMLISDGSSDSRLEDSFNHPRYIQLRQQTTLDEDIRLALLRSTESSTGSESAGFQDVIHHQTSPHQSFLPSPSVGSPVHGHQLQARPLSTQSLGLITSRILVLTAYLDPNPTSSQLSPNSIAELYDTLSVADAIRFCYFLREWGYRTSVRIEHGAGEGSVNGRVVLNLTTWDGQSGQWADWQYILLGQRPIQPN